MKRLLGLVGPALAFIALFGVVGESRAGLLELDISGAIGPALVITAGPVASSTNGGNTLTIISPTGLAVVNTYLVNHGSNVQFSSLSATSDFAPGSGQASGSFVTQTGSVFVDTTKAGTGLLTVRAFQDGFLLPSGTTGSMQSNPTANYTQAPAGSSQTFTSTYNLSVSSLPLTSTSTGTAQNNYSPSNVTPIPTFVTPFSISNTMTFSLLPNTSAQATDNFTGSTLITAASVPEPASLSLILAGGIPLAVFNWIRRRRQAKP